jgi:hypothetical protein
MEHGVHETNPISLPNVPFSHEEHVSDPSVGAYVPTAHLLQNDRPVEDEYDPGEHFVALTDLDRQKWPLGHTV